MLKRFIRKNKYLYTTVKFKKNLRKARSNYEQFDYSHDILFIAGLPKSGTTWLENMLAKFPGYTKNMLPQAVKFEQNHNGSHFLELEKEWLEPLQQSLTVLKLHNYGSPNNARVLKELHIPYIVMYRDLRDVAVSYYFYVKKTWHHPEYEKYKKLSVHEGLSHFARTLLADFKNWIESWEENADPDLSLAIRYEDLKEDTAALLKKMALHFDIDTNKDQINDIIRENSFESVSGGRKQGEENTSSFYRKGISGDWKQYFNPEIKDQFKQVIGKQLIDLRYEEDLDW